MTGGLFEGLKVLDLSEGIAGSFCGRLLADYGADVLKVEPVGGSAMRRVGPFYHDEPHPEKSLFFLILNLNKKGITLNLETEAGRRAFQGAGGAGRSGGGELQAGLPGWAGTWLRRIVGDQPGG